MDVRHLSLAAIIAGAVALPARGQEDASQRLPPIAAAEEAPPVSAGRIFEPAETIAIVGDQHILAGDLLGDINQMLQQYIGKAPEDELNVQRRLLMKQMLPMVIENKILYLEFLRKVPKDKLDEVRKSLYAEFDEEKLGPAMTKANVNSPAEMDRLLRRFGDSLDKQRQKYMEQKLGRAMLGREIDYKPEITHEEMLEYYRTHAEEFDVPARARYEQLTVRVSSKQPQEAAWAKLAGMGNEVLRGAKFEAVAKK